MTWNGRTVDADGDPGDGERERKGGRIIIMLYIYNNIYIMIKGGVIKGAAINPTLAPDEPWPTWQHHENDVPTNVSPSLYRLAKCDTRMNRLMRKLSPQERLFTCRPCTTMQSIPARLFFFCFVFLFFIFVLSRDLCFVCSHIFIGMLGYCSGDVHLKVWRHNKHALAHKKIECDNVNRLSKRPRLFVFFPLFYWRV